MQYAPHLAKSISFSMRVKLLSNQIAACCKAWLREFTNMTDYAPKSTFSWTRLIVHSGFLPYVLQYYHCCNHQVQLTMSFLSLCTDSSCPPGMFYHRKDITDNITISGHQSSNKQQCDVPPTKFLVASRDTHMILHSWNLKNSLYM